MNDYISSLGTKNRQTSFCVCTLTSLQYIHTPFTSVRAKTMCEFQAQTLFHSLPLSLFLSQTTNGAFKLSTWRSFHFTVSSFSYPLLHKRFVSASLLSMFPALVHFVHSLLPCLKLNSFIFPFCFMEDQLLHTYLIVPSSIFLFLFLLGFGIWYEACGFPSPLYSAKFFSHHFLGTEVDLRCQLDLQLCY